MKKGFLLTAIAFCFAASSAFSAITIHYYNKDSKSHQMVVSVDGTTKSVVFDASKTSTVTIQAGATSCWIQTSCGRIEVKDGANITIKDGCFSFNK
jgi:hypothetical protein